MVLAGGVSFPMLRIPFVFLPAVSALEPWLADAAGVFLPIPVESLFDVVPV